jgi:nucleoside-diphosphate-sugar epimerase
VPLTPGAGGRRTYLVTGGCGLVGANLVRHLLATRPGCEVVVLDREEPASVVERFLAQHRDRLTFAQGDITHAAAFDGLGHVTVAIHAATVTHVPEWEVATPRRYVDVNLVGTVNVLEWARSVRSLERFVYVSTGGVYGNQTSASGEAPQSEDGPFAPHELYGISKHAAELLVRRYAELFAFDHRSVRLSGVFGPLERPTGSRTGMSAIHSLVHAAVAERPLRVTARTLDSAGDHISAEDAADGLARLADAAAPRHRGYNLARGALLPFRELVEVAGRAGLAVDLQVVRRPEDAEIDLDPAHRRARWNAYDVTRAREDLAWQPRPLVDQLASYASWLRAGTAEKEFGGATKRPPVSSPVATPSLTNTRPPIIVSRTDPSIARPS